MPQCIAQQDPSAWLNTMTKCTHQRCTSHFGIICTHHQWLTELSCLSTEFSPDVVRAYLPYCSRSVLAKAQLYNWIRSATGRTWLVDVGDANGLQSLSPASLAKGYASIDVVHHAPTCLTGSRSVPSAEPFQTVLASCGFTSTLRHTGNAARPWEYSKSLKSITALSFDSVGYDLTGGHISPGDFFDKECFCSTFTIDTKSEPCSEWSDRISLTMERVWLNATCGPASLPGNWTASLKIMGFGYIPTESWRWPTCVTDMPKEVTALADHCATDACHLNPSSYCEIRPAIDRACFCHNVAYDSCQGPCQALKSRQNYVEWLHDLCGDVPGWHGLPDDWRNLTVPLPHEMIPWRWTVKPNIAPNIASKSQARPLELEHKCPTTQWKFGSIALVGAATIIATYVLERRGVNAGGDFGNPKNPPSHSYRLSWMLKGTLVAGLQLLANLMNGYLVQTTPGFEDVPVFQLTLLWCSLPRLGWLPHFLIGLWHPETRVCSSTRSFVLCDTLLQVLSAYYMLLTVDYGRKYDFYSGGLANANKGQLAMIMYAGALIWAIVIVMLFVQVVRVMHRNIRLIESDAAGSPWWQRHTIVSVKNFEAGPSRPNEDESLLSRPSVSEGIEGANFTVYGTLPTGSNTNVLYRRGLSRLYTVTAMSIPLLSVAQCLFWVGFISVSSEEYVIVYDLPSVYGTNVR